MPITIGLRREFEFTGNDENNDPCLFPRHTANHVFVQAFGFRTKTIASEQPRYLGFPFIVKLGSSLVGIYSEGDSHANSDRQIIIRSDDGGVTWQSTVFFTAATGAFNFSLLESLLTDGQSVLLKVWTVKNVSGVFSATQNSTVSFGGLTYALWSKAVDAPGGKLFRTGYASNGTGTQTALFESSDGGLTWVGKSVIFLSGSLLFNEADIVNTTGTNWLAVVREDSGASNPLYRANSTDGGDTWSAATIFPASAINGRQPNLTKMSDGSILLATGDRSGTSGYGGSAGDQVVGFDTTGITLFRSTDNGANWSFRTRLSPMFSTDGGQPYVNETNSGTINVVFYTRVMTKSSPVIASVTMTYANL